MFWICTENRVENTEIFLLLLSSAYTESRPSLLLTPPHQWVGWGCTRAGRAQSPDRWTPTCQRDIPCHTTSWSAYKVGRRRRKGGHLEWWCLSSQLISMHAGALLSWRWLNTCLMMESTEWIPYFALLAQAAFALPINLSWSQPMSFLNFTLLILSPIPLRQNEQLCGA